MADSIARLYRAYMREQGLSLYGLARTLNNAWRIRGQKPPMNWSKRLTISRA